MKPTRPSIYLRRLAVAAFGVASCATLWLPQSSPAANYTSKSVVGAGNNWNGNYWSANPDGSGTLTGPPTAGNTYELIPNGSTLTSGNDTRTRNPASPGVQTFPGDSLMLDVNSDIRLKGSGAVLNFPGPGGGLPGLILNGGGLNLGDDGKFWIDGIIEVRQQSYIFPATSGGTADNRALNISGKLIGTNNLAMINGGLINVVEISGAANTFSGKWIVKSGYLLGSANGSLGTNSITIDPGWTVPATNGAWALGSGYNKAVMSIAYDLNSAGTLTIANGGQLVLYKNLCFSAVTINGTALSAGSHSYAELAAAFPANILGNGYGHITVQPYGSAPSFPPPTTVTQQWISADVGGPAHAGSVIDNGNGTLDILGGGDDIWNATSRFHYYYAWATGTNWDIIVQVKNFSGPDYWSKVELLVSPADPAVGPQGNDPFIAMMDNQPNWTLSPILAGNNAGGIDQFRTTKGGNADWLQVGNSPFPDYPANWLRITRNGSAFDLYRSSDGQYWRKYITIDTAKTDVVGSGGTKFGTAWPNLVTVGVAVTAHNDGSTVLGDATIANLQGTFPPAQAPSVLAVSVPIAPGVTNSYGCEASLSFAATNNAFPAAALVPVLYQWYKNGTAIDGATNSFHTWLLDNSDNGATYHCTATCAAPYSSLTVTSPNATIGVVPGVYYSNGLKQEMFSGATSRVAVEQGNVNAAAWVGIVPIADDPGGYGNNYVNRVSGWFIPPTTDNYVFFLGCDDDSDLYLSTDDTMGNKRLVAQETGWSGTRSWLAVGAGTLSQKRTDQWSPDGGASIPYPTGISLTAGQRYFIELVHHNGGGGDNFAATYQTATMMADPNWAINFTNGTPSLMDATNGCLQFVTRQPSTLTWVVQPTNTVATLGLAGTFYAKAASDSELTLKYQWYRNNVLIPGATGSAYSIAAVSASDNGAGFTVVATTAENELSITSSPPAVLNVAAPVLETGWAKMEYWYSPNPGRASFIRSVTNGVAITNYLATTYSTPANYTIFEPIFEGNSKAAAPINYTSRLSTYFYPPTTGDYVFFINSDDAGDLYVSTDANPSNAVMVAQETGWSGSWTWNGAGGNGSTAAAKRSDQWTAPDGTAPWSAGIHMVQGQPYYVAIIHQDTGGGNNCEATFKLIGDGDPANGSYSQMKGSVIKTYVPRCFSVSFSQPPVNVSAPFNGTATLTAHGATDSKSAIGDETDPSTQWTNNYVMYQWTRNGTPIPGATGSTLTFGPVSPEDSTAEFVCQIRALGYVDNSLAPIWLDSSHVHITISGTPVYETNFVLHAFYGLNPPRNSIRDGTAGNPDWLMAEPAFEASVNNPSLGNNFSDELIGFFIPPTTGDYVFFCNSDDGAELYLSTDNSALNKRMIAQETAYSTGGLNWGASNGNAAQTRSDTFVDAATGTTPYAAGIHLIQGQKYFMSIVHSQGTGGTHSCVTAKLIGDLDPAQGSRSTMRGNQISCYVPRCTYVNITNSPQSVAVLNYSNATFTAGGTTDSTVPVGNELDWRTQFGNFLFYQWFKNGQPIPGANASTLTLQNVLPSDNGSIIVAKMRALGYADANGNALWAQSSPAILTVITSAPPTLVHSGYYTNYGTSASLIGQQGVTLHFTSPMDPTALLDPANYVLGGGLTIDSILVNSNTYHSVSLVVSGTPTWPLNVTINNAHALGGGPALAGSNTIKVTPAVLSSVDIGAANDPVVPSYIDVFGASAFLVSCEGSDIWNNADGCNYLFEQKTGDFDVVVRQKSITKVSNWSKGGLMIRESLDPGSRQWSILNTPLSADGLQGPAADGTGANLIQCVGRAGGSGASADWTPASTVPPSYPDAWLRLSRQTVTNIDATVGSIISGYFSADGLNWTSMGQIDTSTNGDLTALPETVYVGIASTAHHNDALGAWPLLFVNTAEYDNYSSSYVPTPNQAVLTCFVSGKNLSISWTPAGGHLESSAVVGPGANWQPVVPNTNPASIPMTSSQMFFRVVYP